MFKNTVRIHIQIGETLIFSFNEESKEFWKKIIKIIKKNIDVWVENPELYNAGFDLSLQCITGDCEDYLHELEDDVLENVIAANVGAVMTLLTCNKFTKSGIEVFGKNVEEIVNNFISEDECDE